jgi:hypothetical protein
VDAAPMIRVDRDEVRVEEAHMTAAPRPPRIEIMVRLWVRLLAAAGAG